MGLAPTLGTCMGRHAEGRLPHRFCRHHQLRHNCSRHHHGYLYRYRIVVRRDMPILIRSMPMYMLSSLSSSPCYRYRYRTAALRGVPMLRHTGHTRVHVVIVIVLAGIVVLRAMPTLTHTGHVDIVVMVIVFVIYMLSLYFQPQGIDDGNMHGSPTCPHVQHVIVIVIALSYYGPYPL